MTKNKRQDEAAIADAGPLIHLDELACLHLLQCYKIVWVPQRVSTEAEKHRPGWKNRGPNIFRIVSVESATVESLRGQIGVELDAGELESLALWKQFSAAVVVCDDMAARKVASEMGASVIGTLGLIMKAAKQRRLDIKSAVALILSIPEETTLHIRADLLEYAATELKTRLGRSDK